MPFMRTDSTKNFKEALIKTVLDTFETMPWRLSDEGIVRWEFSQLSYNAIHIAAWRSGSKFPEYYTIKITQHT